MTELQIDEFFAHYGVKGMHWGVRKANRLTLARNVARGRADLLDRTHFALTTQTGRLIIAKGSLKKAARMEVKELEAQKTRIESGKALLSDKVEFYLNTPLKDLVDTKE